ncbi:MAG: FG-GAP-like repeat-containing protein, partial [Bacteroidia bacterium]
HAAGFHAGIAKPSKYYINTGNFSPQLKTGYAFTDSLRPYTVPYWSDYDLDGDMDLFIASGPANGTPAYDYCYKNLKIETGKDTLQRMTSELFASQKQDGQCYNFVDCDNDGDFDLCLTNYISAPSRFYKNNGGTYTSVTTPFTFTGNSLANCWGDYDNDGDLDVIITRDNAVSQEYRNDGTGTFTLLSAGISVPAGASGVSNGDYDNDGDLDLFFNGLNTARSLYRNDTVALSRNWINFNFTGTVSNTSAIGTIIKLKAVINSVPVWQLREVNAQNSFQSQNDLRVHFGLDKATVVDSVIVKWPSGLQQTFSNMAVNSFYQVTEGNPFIPLAIAADDKRSDFTAVPNPASDRIEIRFSDEHKLYAFELLDLAGHSVYKGKSAGFSTVNTSALESGIYFLQLSIGNETASKKIIVMH